LNRLVRPLPIAVAATVVALVALLTYGVVSKEEDTGIEGALANGERPQAADIRLPELGGGGQQALSDYRGKVVLLNYWASWCDPCREESPLLQRWHEQASKQGGTVVGVDVLDVTEDAQAFIREYKLSYPMLKDADGDTHKDFGVLAYPETFAIDRKGRIAAVRRGPVDQAWLQKEVAPLLEEPS
jgi:cytochrome c biogenesis protein CcmG, thiol:disulfide interchange protein DsbE